MRPTRLRHERLRRATIAAGAAAASIAAIVGLAVLLGQGTSGNSPSPESAAGGAGAPARLDGMSYDAARVNAMADSLARAAADRPAAGEYSAGAGFSGALRGTHIVARAVSTHAVLRTS